MSLFEQNPLLPYHFAFGWIVGSSQTLEVRTEGIEGCQISEARTEGIEDYRISYSEEVRTLGFWFQRERELEEVPVTSSSVPKSG